VVGLLAAILGDMFYWWVDPAGAIALAIYTIVNWSGTVMENASRLLCFFQLQNFTGLHEFYFQYPLFTDINCLKFRIDH